MSSGTYISPGSSRCISSRYAKGTSPRTGDGKSQRVTVSSPVRQHPPFFPISSPQLLLDKYILTNNLPNLLLDDQTKIPSLLDANLPRTHFGDSNTPLNTYLGIGRQLASALDNINPFAKAAAVLCSIGVTLTWLALLLSIPYLFRSAVVVSRFFAPLVWANLGLTVGALFFLLLGAFVASIGAVASRDRVNDLGEDAGVGAVMGTRWVTLAWAAFAVLLVVLVTWVWEVVGMRRGRLAGEVEGDGGGDEEEEGGGQPPPLPPVPPPSFARPPPPPPPPSFGRIPPPPPSPTYRPPSRGGRSGSRRRRTSSSSTSS
jgi:hypothetical protein